MAVELKVLGACVIFAQCHDRWDMGIMTELGFLERSIALALDSVASGGGPFGAVISCNGQIIAEACNGVTLHNDPTAHAEIGAIRQAAAVLGRPHLDDCVLYASCEPCPMCLAAILWAHIPRVVFASTYAEAGRAGFADTHIALQLYGQARPVAPGEGVLTLLELEHAAAPFDAWLAKADRREY
jgi:guanine deaminase